MKTENDVAGNDKEFVFDQEIKVFIEIPNQNNIYKNISIKVTNKIRMSDLMKEAIKLFNVLFNNMGVPYELAMNINLYKMRASKKSGKPNCDMPCNILYYD